MTDDYVNELTAMMGGRAASRAEAEGAVAAKAPEVLPSDERELLEWARTQHPVGYAEVVRARGTEYRVRCLERLRELRAADAGVTWDALGLRGHRAVQRPDHPAHIHRLNSPDALCGAWLSRETGAADLTPEGFLRAGRHCQHCLGRITEPMTAELALALLGAIEDRRPRTDHQAGLFDE